MKGVKLSTRWTAFSIVLLGLLVVSFQNCAPGFEAMKTPAFLSGGAAGGDPEIPEFPADIPADPNGPLTVFVRNTNARQGDDLVFNVELNKVSAADVVVQLATESGTALPAVDFTDTQTSVTIPAGALITKLTISGFIYSAASTSKLMKLRAVSATGAAIGQSDGAGLIKAVHKLESLKHISSGYFHTCGITPLGAVRCWGYNTGGQLGNNTLENSRTPVDVIGVTGATELTSGNVHTCALVAGGRVKCWGLNLFGQLGNGVMTESNPVAVDVSGLLGVKKIEPGSVYTCAITAQDRVACWGSNTSGQLGTGTLIDSSLPVEVPGLNGALDVAAGVITTCAITNLGETKCWGGNGFGQLGNGTTVSSLTPVDVTGLTGAKKISVGFQHACAVTAQNGVSCWGNGVFGQLGNGTLVASAVPVAVTGATNVSSLSVGSYHSCATAAGGLVKCWGRNSAGQIGTGVNRATEYSTAVDVIGVTGASMVTAGFNTSCVVTTLNAAKCWGSNAQGQLGSLQSRRDIVGLSGINQIGNGQQHACALTSAGTVKCWGSNGYGQIGNGTSVLPADAPVEVIGVSGATQLAVGNNHACALVANGATMCWGYNMSGQSLGNTSAPNVLLATTVSGLTGLKKIVAGGESTCAITATDSVKCWGSNSNGQLGTGNMDDTIVPADVVGLTSVQQLSLSYRHACALTSAGLVSCWGMNNFGQLGDGTRVSTGTPLTVTGLTGVKSIATGYNTSCAITATDTLKCWGSGTSGLLGNNTVVDSLTPVDVSSLTGVRSLAIGDVHACAVTMLGAVKCWGQSYIGQFGFISTALHIQPIDGLGFAGTAQVSIGYESTRTIRSNGGVRQFGSVNQTSPVAVDVVSVAP